MQQAGRTDNESALNVISSDMKMWFLDLIVFFRIFMLRSIYVLQVGRIHQFRYIA